MTAKPLHILSLIISLTCLMAEVATAATPAPFYLRPGQEEMIIPFSRMAYVEDTADTLTFRHVTRHPELFSVNPRFRPPDYNAPSTYWVKLDIRLPEKGQSGQLLEFYDQTIDEITFYSPREDGTYQTIRMGDALPFHEKLFLHKNFEVLLPPDLQGVHTFYFKVKSHSYADIRVALRTLPRFVHYALNEYFLYGIFYGMIVIITLYNLLIYSAIKEIKYLYYTFYILSVGIYAMCVDGIAYQYLWPGSPQWNQIAYGTALFAVIFWILLFSMKFLNTSVRAPWLHKALLVVLGARCLYFLTGIMVDNRLFDYQYLEIIPLSLIFLASIAVLIRGYKPARFFVVAYGFLFLGFLVKGLVYLSIIPFSILSYYSLHVSFLLEMLFLTFALSDRVRILKSNRDRALRRIIRQQEVNAELKDEVNRELEKNVKQRTRELQAKNLELEELNQKLFEQTREIGRINSLLDLDNWKLKNNMKQILQDRFINKNLTPEQFRNIFPDQLSCYRFLEKMKWEKGFYCIKCNHDNYTDGTAKFSRRCTRCGYVESVTSNTVFHGIRFPIEKAFYILYVTNNRQTDYTLDELSEVLDLRRNTVWRFRKKIEKLYASGNKDDSTLLIYNLFSGHL
ncbi:7TM diverse intracellular signaling domain-containing protein [Roseivirga sp. BDSF3-8]|uniref:7TM diverse intracellular signaling domain-containing protein n=1 Tax=Roseivirga sp. BDSF3-8 TaxID=3241598 RepID=UPI00353245D7